jgi:hypothetical protein
MNTAAEGTALFRPEIIQGIKNSLSIIQIY